MTQTTPNYSRSHFLFSGKVFKNTIKCKKLFWTSSWFPLSPAYSIRPHCSLHLLNFSKWVDVISRGNSDFHRTTWCRICALDCNFYDVYVLVGNNNTTSEKSRKPDFAESFLLLNLDFEYFIYCTYDTNVAWIMFFENLNLIRTILVSWMCVRVPVCKQYFFLSLSIENFSKYEIEITRKGNTNTVNRMKKNTSMPTQIYLVWMMDLAAKWSCQTQHQQQQQQQ